MSLCNNEWVLNLDGDECLNEAVVERFAKVVQDDEADSVRLWRNDLFIGRSAPKSIRRPNNLRLYKKSKSSFDPNDLVHESANVEGTEIFIDQAFEHYGYQSIDVLIAKINQYSTLKAQEKFKRKKKFSYLKLSLVMPLTFIKLYLIKRYFLFGTRGFIKSVMDSHYAFLKEAKLYEVYEINKQENKGAKHLK